MHTKQALLVLVSGNGSNLQALIDAERDGRLNKARLAAVIANTPHAFALERARAAGIKALTIMPDKNLPKRARARDFSDKVLAFAEEHEIELLVLAGFLLILEGDLLTRYAGRIINIHPSLLPKFGGAGMYGARVHETVLAAGETESGCTVHFVDAGTDTGARLLQRKVPVLPDDSPQTLAERIHHEEHRAIVEAVQRLTNR
ncbi:MAG: phosphoribosylglycinamide formyltransferase [Spirochaetaceae bacterium]|jgi:phosphoribosylglycinamide formyltransferase-1|nr:phosphoribosylglycinamide formyltransferase [Spirochaetaceae bacterium]